MSRRPAVAAAAPRVVFDTALLLRSLLAGSSAALALRQSWQDAACQPLVDADAARGLMLALGAPSLGLSAAQQQELLADFLPYAQVVQRPQTSQPLRPQRGLPLLQRQALTLARQARARWLVSDSPALQAYFERHRVARPLELVSSEKFLAGL